MTFDEAMREIAQGHKVKRRVRPVVIYLQAATAVTFDAAGNPCKTRFACSTGQYGTNIAYAFSDDEIAATDWRVVADKPKK